jgi:hypothetical protein
MQSLLPYFQQNFKNKEGWKDIFQALKGMEERKEERKEGRNEGRNEERKEGDRREKKRKKENKNLLT